MRALPFALFLGALACNAQAQQSPAAAVNTAMSPATAATPAPSRVCFSVTMQCFAAKTTPDAAPPRLDLRAPPIAKVVAQAELTALPDPDEPNYDEPQVKVKGERERIIEAPGGLLSLPWAVRHPTQAWRIFLPSPSRVVKEDEDKD